MKKILFLLATMGVLVVSCEDSNIQESFNDNFSEQPNGGNDDKPQSDNGQYIPGVWVCNDGLRVLQFNQPSGTTKLDDGILMYKFGTYTEYILSSKNSNKFTYKFTGIYYCNVFDDYGRFHFESAVDNNNNNWLSLDIEKVSKDYLHLYKLYPNIEYSFSKGDESDIPSQWDLEGLVARGGNLALIVDYSIHTKDLFQLNDEDKEVRRVKKGNKVLGTYSILRNTLTCYYDQIFSGTLNAFSEIDDIPQTVKYSITYNENLEFTIDGVNYWVLFYRDIPPTTVNIENFTLQL